MSTAPVGIFDSGIGGLTVARAVQKLLPHESTIYLGDTARVPYGPKSPETVRRYAREIAEWLLSQHVKAIVIACNTATAHALDDLRRFSPVPVIGVIEPGARAAVAATRSGRIGVIGTQGTIRSAAYRRALVAARPALELVETACPLFVPLVEEGWFAHPATRLIAEDYLGAARQQNVDTLVLGCTHYPMLKPLIAQVMGRDVVLIDSGEQTAEELATVLRSAGLAAPVSSVATHRWAATDDVARFAQVGAVFMGMVPAPVEMIDLADGSASREAGEIQR
ncbi:MAG TPA: glutamate racemase [Gemmatimonadales bacterium]|jgi:glutamate racemase